MQNFIFKYNGHEYVTLFGINYLGKKVEDTAILPDGALDAVRKTLSASAILEDINMSKDFSSKTVVTARVRVRDKLYQLDTANTVEPLRDITEIETVSSKMEDTIPPKEDVVAEPVREDSIPTNQEPEQEEVVQTPEPIVEAAPVVEPVIIHTEDEPVEEVKPEPMEDEVKPAMESSASAVTEKTEEPGSTVVEEESTVTAEDLTPAYNPVYLTRCSAYSLAPINMLEVAEKGDAYCEMHKWAKVDDLYMIDDVVSVVRCVHSDKWKVNLTIPYTEVVNNDKH